MDELTEVFKERSKTADIVLVNGGLGPTTDDLTAEAASIVSGQPLEISNQCLEHLKHWKKIRGIKLTDINSKQAFFIDIHDISSIKYTIFTVSIVSQTRLFGNLTHIISGIFALIWAGRKTG